MKRRYLIPLFIVLLSSVICTRISAEKRYVVKAVYDGDTIQLSNGQKIRYLGIDAPEIERRLSDGTIKPAAPFSNESKTFNHSLVFRKYIRLAYDIEKTDSYGRTLAYVFLEDGTFINKKLIEHGLAYCLWKAPNTKYYAELLSAQKIAMAAQKGMWANWKEESAEYIGNVRSNRFHHKNCTFGKRTSRKNRRYFKSQWTAYYEGFSPCNKCILKRK